VALLPLAALAGDARQEPGAQEPALLLYVSPRDDAKQLVARFPENTDLSETYFGTPAFGVHMHIMGPEQCCPLHLHPRGYEAAIIVAGTGELTHLAAPARPGGQPRPRSSRVKAGDVVISPPGSSHALANTTPAGHLATLVISAPPFTGNLYLAQGDARQISPDPTIERLGAPLRELRAGGAGIVRRKLPFGTAVGLDRLEVTSRQRLVLQRSTLFYVAEGIGILTLREGGAGLPLEPGSLVGVRSGRAVTITPGPQRSLALVALSF